MFCSLGFKVQTLRHIVWKTFLLSLAYIYKTKKPRVGVSYKSMCGKHYGGVKHWHLLFLFYINLFERKTSFDNIDLVI